LTSTTDIELMEKVRDGDLPQLAHLFERHHIKLYNFYLRLTGRRDLSEDFVQEVFFRILKYRHTFRGDGEFTLWMYRIARNVHIDHHRKRTRAPAIAEEYEEPATEDPHAQELLEQRQTRKLLRQAFARLPDEKREVLILSRYQGLRYEVIATLLGCSVDAVKVRVHRAMNELRTVFFRLSGEKADD
jgi:RNA polymerase sigma-70 factor (ECF subfamily)